MSEWGERKPVRRSQYISQLQLRRVPQLLTCEAQDMFNARKIYSQATGTKVHSAPNIHNPRPPPHLFTYHPYLLLLLLAHHPGHVVILLLPVVIVHRLQITMRPTRLDIVRRPIVESPIPSISLSPFSFSHHLPSLSPQVIRGRMPRTGGTSSAPPSSWADQRTKSSRSPPAGSSPCGACFWPPSPRDGCGTSR